MEFRTLRPEEIEVRAARCTQKGVQLLLYKDARCDMAMLDETLGPENWQRKHEEHNGNLFCSVGVKTDDGWVWKEDAGAESNTEAEKGHASDSFKRACVNWGIGRELYTSPFIWVPGCVEQKNERWVCNERFRVSRIEYSADRQISELEISGKAGVAFSWKAKEAAKKKEPEDGGKFLCARCGAVMKPVKSNGEEIPVRAVYERTIAKYGRPLCVKCAKEEEREIAG